MTIDFSEDGKVKFYMQDYIKALLAEAPEEIMKGSATTPAANHLFQINPEATKLDMKQAETFHHLTAKLLYLCKRTRPDLQMAVAFLTTRVQNPDIDDFKKLGRCLRYIQETKDIPLILTATDPHVIQWWVDASFAIHPDMKSHTGATMSMGRGSIYSLSTKQKINTRSSTEAELVGVNDAMSLIIWTRNFLEDQGFSIKDNVVFQDNESAMLLERNGRASSSKRTRHIEIRYFFVTDNIHRGRMRVSHCPTDRMVADFFTKPLQGTSFRKFRNLIMNHDDGICDESCDTRASHPVAQECVGSSHPEVNPEARATRVSCAGTGMPMTMHLHQEGKPVMEVLQELPQELPLMTHERTYAQVVVGHRPPRSENFKPLTPCSKTL